MKHRKPTSAWQMLGLKISKKVVVGITAAATALGGLAIASTAAQANTGRDSYADTTGNPTFEAAREKYGLTKNMKNGAILHAWMWSFNTITEHMDEIAEAGYTSIQTEPMSKIKEVPANGKKFTENWYYVYQPANTSIGNFVVGTEADLKKMTAAAHAHGIRIIVDVVANHFTADWNAIDPDWQNPEYFHDKNACKGRDINYSNRWEVTHCQLLGLWDLNTANKTVESRMHDFLKTAVDDGVDGFRFDAGKHVELPGEFDNSTYWDVILQNGAQYQYGEVLQGDPGLDYKAYAALYAKYGKGGGGATASDYGKAIRGALKDKNLNAGNLNSLRGAGIADDHLVTWVESHDNYANGDKESTYLTSEQIRFGWAIVGARKGGAPLFFNRPKDSGGNKPQFAETSQLGDAGDDEWKKPEVVAVNQFRNAMDGEDEYLRNCGANQNNNSCLMVERYATDNKSEDDGVSIANMGGDQDLAGTPTKLDDGTYTDQVNGGKIVVKNGKIESGTAKGNAVSVYFTPGVKESVSATASKKFSSDTMKVTLSARNAKNLSYKLSNGKNGSFVDGDSLTIGEGMNEGDSVTLTVTGTGTKSGKALEYTATYTKVAFKQRVVYAKKPSNWQNLYVYAYRDDPSADEQLENAAWPGEAMTAVTDGDSCGQTAGTYRYELPDWGDTTYRVIFTDGKTGTSTKYPADSDTDIDAAGLESTGTQIWNGDTSQPSSSTWSDLACSTSKVTKVTISGDTSMDLSSTQTLQLKASVTTDPAGGSASVSWSSSDTDLATVDSTGKVTGLKAGTVKITAKAGGKSATVTLTLTGVRPQPPVAKNTIYATKPAGWSKMYAYVYTGDGATAASNAKWPGVEMSKADNCDQTGYKYEVPDNLAKNAKVIFNDGGSQQYPGSREPGLDYDGGIVKWDGSSAALAALECSVTVPVTSVSISGDGVSNGKLSLKAGASAQLTATILPENATDRKVTWTSSDSSVANVMGTGVVTAGRKAGTATVTASAGGRSASVRVSVTVPDETVDITFKASDVSLKAGETLYAVGDWGQANAWKRAGGVRLAKSGGAYTGTVQVRKGHAVTARLVKVDASGRTTWDKIGDVKATADRSKTVGLKWDNTVDKTVDVTINAAADLKSGETLYAVGDWGQANAWKRGSGVRLAKSGNMYTGTAKVDKGHAMAFRLIKVDASGRTTWDPAKDRKTTADRTKSLGVAWNTSKVNEDGTIPDDSEISISGKGVVNGKLTMQAHHLNELYLVGANTSDKATWWSDSAAIAVSGAGVVYAVQAGTAKVSAKVGSKVASVDVTVEDNSTVKVSSVTISGDSVSNGKLSIIAGKSVQLSAAVLPENATNKTVSWTSSNSSVANVMGTGLLTAGKAGTATITATADGVSSKITVTVTSAPQPSGDIVIAGAESGKVVGNEEFQLTAREKDGSSFKNVEWSIPNTDLLKFINGGFSKTSTGRTVNLKAEFSFMRDDYADTVVSVKATRADGTVLTAQKKLSVGGYDSWSNSDPVDSITPSADGLVKTGDNEYTLTMSAGSSKHVDLKVLPSNARQLPLWSKLGGDDSVVTVDGDGTIYAHTAGTFQTGATIYNRYFNLTVVVE